MNKVKSFICNALRIIGTLIICIFIASKYVPLVTDSQAKSFNLHADKYFSNIILKNEPAVDMGEKLKPMKEEKKTLNSATKTYKVKKGDSIERIAAKFILLPWHLRKANGMKPGVIIHPGQVLKIPEVKWKPYEGLASFYGDQGGLFHGKAMANGERYDQNDMVAAHRHYPFGLKLLVINLLNGREVVVTVKDRGPFVDTDIRQIDLSVAAAKELGMYKAGLTHVKIIPLS